MTKTKLTSIDVKTANALMPEVIAALADFGAKYGLHFRAAGGQVGSKNWTMKIEAAIVNADGSVETKGVSDFKRYQKVHGLPMDAIGTEFTYGGKQWILRGFNPGAPKYAFSADRVADGKGFRLTFEGVKRAFERLAQEEIPSGPKTKKGPAITVGEGTFKKGQKVMARWSDGQMYKAKYLKIGVRPGFHRVQFEDGTVYGTKVLNAI